MPRVALTPSFVANPPNCPEGRLKIDYFDTQLPGFLLEVRASGKCTYYQRYRDRFGRTGRNGDRHIIDNLFQIS